MPKNRIHTLSDSRYAYSGTDAAGKRHKLASRTGESKRAFARRCDQLDEQMAGQVVINTFGQLFDQWTDMHLKPKCSGGDVNATVGLYERHVRPMLAHRPVSDITRADIYSVLTKADKAGLSASTISKVRGCISRPFNWAINTLGLRLNSPTSGLRYQPSEAKPDKRRRHLTDSEVDKIIRAGQGSKYCKAIQIMLLAGLRPSEVMGLQARDVKDNHLEIRRGVTGYGISPLKTKTARRDVPLTEEVAAILTSLKQSTAFRSPDGWLFYCEGALGGQPSMQQLQRALKRFVARANKPVKLDTPVEVTPIRASVYDWRHTFATRMAERGMRPEVLRSIMGHADIRTTLTYYVDVTKTMIDQARDIMANKQVDEKLTTKLSTKAE